MKTPENAKIVLLDKTPTIKLSELTPKMWIGWTLDGDFGYVIKTSAGWEVPCHDFEGLKTLFFDKWAAVINRLADIDGIEVFVFDNEKYLYKWLSDQIVN